MLETGDLQRHGCLTLEASMGCLLGLDPGTGCWGREGTEDRAGKFKLTPGQGAGWEDGLPNPALLI